LIFHQKCQETIKQLTLKIERLSQEMENIRLENETLKKTAKEWEQQIPNLKELLAMINDVHSYGRGYLEFHRVDPDSIFLQKP